MSDYVRHLPEASADLARGPRWTERFHVDPVLVLLLLAVTAYGLVVLYSASGQDWGAVTRQGRNFLLGYVGMIFIAQFKPQSLQRWAPPLFLVGIGLLLAVMFFGSGAKGAQRWLSLGGLRFQPSEIMKLLVPLTVAWYLSSRLLPPRFRYILASLALLLLPAGLVAQQPDLGTALLIAASGLFVLFLAGVGWRYIVGALGLVIASAWPAWVYGLRDYQKQRILTLLNPESDKLGTGWNIIQSKTAIGSGGWSGKGWLEGTQSRLDFLPESHTDFVIAVLAEEFGLRGVLALMALYLLLLVRGLWISIQAQHTFSRLVAGSITLTFFVYVFVNMGMVSGLLPVVGIPLPLVSAGGTSILTLMAGFGILMAISTERRLLGTVDG
jgi:rod shape determining protein RodA